MRKLSGAMLIGLFGLFLLAMAMPWMVVSCGNTDMLEQSGFQLASGEVEMSEDFKTMMENLGKEMEGGEIEGLDETTGDMDAVPWLWLALLGSLAAAVGGGLVLTNRRQGAMIAVGGAAVALLVLLASLAIAMPIEQDIEKKNAEAAEEADEMTMEMMGGPMTFETTHRGGFWLAIFAAAGQLIFAGLALRQGADDTIATTTEPLDA